MLFLLGDLHSLSGRRKFDDFLVAMPALVFFQRRNRDQRLPRVSAMDRLAVVTKRNLSEALGITRRLCPFGPGVAIAMEGDACDAEAPATLLELGGTVGSPHSHQVRKQRSS